MPESLLNPIESVNLQSIQIRPLRADDSQAYRSLRKKILDIGDGKYFSDSYEREKTFTCEEQWREWCTEKQEHCTIGTFLDGELIGIMGIIQYGHPSARTVEWEATWIAPQYRKFGVAKLGYQAVHQWTIDHGYNYAVVFIKEDNTRSREIREKQGAIYIYTKYNEVWADGSIANTNAFIIDLTPVCKEKNDARKQAIRRLEAIMATLQYEPDTESAENIYKSKEA